MRYRSIIGFGRAIFVDDPAEKKRGLDIIMQHYAGGQLRSYEYSEKALQEATIIRMDIDSMTGKQSGY